MVPKRNLLFQEIIVQVPAFSFRMCKHTLSSSCFCKWVFPKIGIPPKWMVYNGKSPLKWMISGYTPIFGNILTSKITSTYAAATSNLPNSMFLCGKPTLHAGFPSIGKPTAIRGERDSMRSRLCLRAWQTNTPLKFNMEPENGWLEDVFPMKIVAFKGTC